MASPAEAIRPTIFNSVTGTAAAKNRPRHKAKADMTQIVEMQKVLHRIVTSPDVEPKDASACARAWSELRTRKREMLGLPVPGQLRPIEHPKKRKVKEQVSFSPAPETTPPVEPDKAG